MFSIEKAIKDIQSGDINREVLTKLLSVTSREEFKPVFDDSARLCKKYFGNKVYIRGIIEFSNYCRKSCEYCGINKSNKKVKRYRMTLEEIIEAAVYMKKCGAMTVVLQSGEDQGYDKTVLEAVKVIHNDLDMAITLSVGEREPEVYRKFYKAGADRYLLRIETTDPLLFKRLHTDDNLIYRKNCLKVLKKIGYEVGTGIMVGLPGQSVESIADDLMYFKELNPAMVGIGPFLAHQDTSLRNHKNTDIFLTLKTLALIRLILPKSNLPATTAMGTIVADGRQQALKIGANVIMPNFTPSKYRDSYKLYDNKICISEEYGKCASCTTAIAMAVGKRIVKSKGYSKNS